MAREDASLVIDFIFNNNDLVDRNLLSQINQGSDVAISKALMQIHHGGLPNKEKRASRTFSINNKDMDNNIMKVVGNPED